jgi:hypothetical protein
MVVFGMDIKDVNILLCPKPEPNGGWKKLRGIKCGIKNLLRN